MPAPQLWRERHAMIAPEHALELDSRAAIHEISGGMHRGAAEDQAYQDYIKTHLVHSAGHHLAGIRAAHVVGDHDAAREHQIHYALVMGALGLDPHGEPPSQVAALARDPKITPVYQFKNHGSDAVALEYLRKRTTGKKMTPLGKAEGEIVPLGGHIVTSDPHGDTWDLSHLLAPSRRAGGERLLVQETGARRTAHHIKDDQGRRIPLASFDHEGTAIEGEPPADVVRSAGNALRARRTATAASIASGARAIGI
jgi:hypothetical protein